MNRAAGVVAFVFVACGTLLAGANAPPDQYTVFGPQAQSIEDKQTHLLWQRVIDPSPVAQFDGAGLCAASNERLPTYRELLTLVDEDGHPEWDPDAGTSTLRYIDPNAFPGTPAAEFWSMSPGKNSNTFKVVDFGTGETRDEGNVAYVRCVVDLP